MAVDHLDIVVSSLQRSLAFYRGLLGPLGYEREREGEIVGERGERVIYPNTAERQGSVSLRQALSPSRASYERYSVGLHHLCFSCANRAVVDERARWLRGAGTEIDCGPREYDYTPGYYPVFFYDPDGLKLELVHRPPPDPARGGSG